MKLVPPPVFVALLVIAFPGFSSFAFTVHALPNVRMLLIEWTSGRNAPEGSSEEFTEASAEKALKEIRVQTRQKAAEEREERERFENDETTKADLVIIRQSVEFLKAFHLEQIEAILGPRQEIQENYLLPAAYPYGMITLSGHQNAGEATSAFFPVGELGGVYVIQYEKRATISGGAVYLKRDHSYQTDDRIGEKRIEARDAERPELEAIKAALEQRIAAHRSE